MILDKTMPANHDEFDLGILYPRQPGIILKTYHLQQKLEALFGITATLEEHTDTSFLVLVNRKTVYSNMTASNFVFDHEEIVRAISKYKTPALSAPESDCEQVEPNDPEHQQWMNSVCSGE